VNGGISLADVHKVYRRSSGLRRFHSLKGALFHRQLWQREPASTFVALAGVDLEVEPGEAVAIIGPNGSGKSTILKLISGVLQPTRGTVDTEGRVTALIELGAGFHPEITGRENVVINGMLLGMTRKEIISKLEEIVAFAGIDDFIDQPVKTYSSGMYVRLGFAVATAVEPAILLIDEVLSVGDASFSQRSLDRLARMRRQGVTMVLVSHDLDLVSTFADRAVYLRQGRVLAQGNPATVIARYRNDVAEECGTGGSPGKTSADQEANRERWGSGQVRITSVHTSSGERELRVLPSGADCTITISYEVRDPVEDFVFGVGWNRTDGRSVAGHNTHLDGLLPSRLAGSGSVSCVYDSLQLAPGEYLLDVAVHSIKGKAYDYWCGAHQVKVTADVAWPGVWAPPHRWISQGPEWEP